MLLMRDSVQLLGVSSSSLLEIGLQLLEGVEVGFPKRSKVLEEGVEFELFGFQLEDVVFYVVYIN